MRQAARSSTITAIATIDQATHSSHSAASSRLTAVSVRDTRSIRARRTGSSTPVEAVEAVEAGEAKIYRIVPADTPAGLQEFDEINRIGAKHHEEPYGSFQEIANAVRDDGHIPQVRALQLKSGAIT